jgi:hypothetical protein
MLLLGSGLHPWICCHAELKAFNFQDSLTKEKYSDTICIPTI